MKPILSIAMGLLMVGIGIILFPDPIGYRRCRVEELEECHE